jgi:hypothetical protein
MTKYLWTGELEFCVCGHHVTDHETSQMDMMCIALSAPPLVLCRGGDRSRICNCACEEFRPYIIGIEELQVEDIAEGVTKA